MALNTKHLTGKEIPIEDGIYTIFNFLSAVQRNITPGRPVRSRAVVVRCGGVIILAKHVPWADLEGYAIMIPETTKDSLLDAIRRFDEDLRDAPEWEDWERQESHKYAIDRKSTRLNSS